MNNDASGGQPDRIIPNPHRLEEEATERGRDGGITETHGRAREDRRETLRLRQQRNRIAAREQAKPIVFEEESLTWEKAIELVGVIIGEFGYAAKRANIRPLSKIFRRFPSVLFQSFTDKASRRQTALWHSLRSFGSSPHCQIIVDILSGLSPFELMEVLEKPGEDGSLAIHTACRFGGDNLVQFLLANQKPELMQRFSKQGYLPFHLSLENGTLSDETMIKLVELSPQGMDSARLIKALRASYSLGVLQTMLTMWPNTVTQLNLQSYRGHTISLSKEQINAFGDLLLPKIKTLELNSTWTLPTFQLLLEKLETNQSIVEIGYLSLPILVEAPKKETRDMLQAFQNVLKNNKTLKKVRGLRSFVGGNTVAEGWLRAINEGLENNTTLDKLEFTMHTVSLELTRNKDAKANEPALTSSIKCPRFLFGHGILDFARHCLPRFSSFERVRLCSTRREESEDATEEVVSLLNLAKHVGCHGYKLNLTTVLEALRTNSKLRSLQANVVPTTEHVALCLEVLQKDNTTLAGCEALAQSDPRIRYYLDLNRLGRVHARSNHTRDLVDALVLVSSDGVLQRSKKTREMRVLSILFGLLQEEPWTWCCFHATPSLTGKRKRQHDTNERIQRTRAQEF